MTWDKFTAALFVFMLSSFGVPSLSWAQPSITCLPNERGELSLVPLRPEFFTVSDSLGGFDPCEDKVKFRIPVGANKPPLIISVHGGGGIHDVLKSDEAFFRHGMATLVFDAYAMQGLTGRNSLFWARSVTNEARQRMIYATAMAAYHWAKQRTDIHSTRIYLFGVSNGAAVVANMAAAVDPHHVKGVIAEGITPIGLGLPDEIRVPVQLVFGKLDDFGNADLKGNRWTLTDDCRLNIRFTPVPAGSSAYCNQNTPGRRIPNALEWSTAVQKRGGQVEMVYVEDMAHNAYFGPLVRRTATWGNGQTLGASLGATDAARAEFFKTMVNFIERH
jgi:dienelactone hydrolase